MQADTGTGFNRRKAEIFFYISHVNRSITATDLIYNQDLSSANARKRLSKMHLQGYLHRRGRGKYTLTTKGDKIRLRLKSRVELEQATGVPVSLNLRRSVPFEAIQKYKDLTGAYPINL